MSETIASQNQMLEQVFYIWYRQLWALEQEEKEEMETPSSKTEKSEKEPVRKSFDQYAADRSGLRRCGRSGDVGMYPFFWVLAERIQEKANIKNTQDVLDSLGWLAILAARSKPKAGKGRHPAAVMASSKKSDDQTQKTVSALRFRRLMTATSRATFAEHFSRILPMLGNPIIWEPLFKMMVSMPYREKTESLKWEWARQYYQNLPDSKS